MAEYFPLEELSQIYLIDLCEPLLEVARRRFNARGWKNIQVLCQDAQEFTLPGLKEEQRVDLFTCSYSLSMVSGRSVCQSEGGAAEASELIAERPPSCLASRRSRPFTPSSTASTTCSSQTPASLASPTSTSRARRLLASRAP